MIIQTATFAPYGADIIVALVASEHTETSAGDAMLAKIQPHFPTAPIMLVSVEDNGFRAFAKFQTSVLLALLQLELLTFTETNISLAPNIETELPF